MRAEERILDRINKWGYYKSDVWARVEARGVYAARGLMWQASRVWQIWQSLS